MLELGGDENDDVLGQLLQGNMRAIAGNDPFFLQAFQPLPARRVGQIHPLGQRRLRDPPFFAKDGQDFDIAVIKLEHRKPSPDS